MPIYEYECGKCRRISSFLVRNVSSHESPACPKCGHRRMKRAISRFAALEGGRKREDAGGGPPADDDRAPAPSPGGPGDDMGDEAMPDLSALDGLDENDPRSMGRVMRKMAEQTGEKLEPEMEEVCRRLEAGEDPESIEEKMGDVLGDDAGGGGPGGGPSDELYDG